jgi:plastocyanin
MAPLARPLFIAALILGSAAAPAAAPAWDQAEQVEIVLSNFAFTPKVLQLHQGRPYRLHFVNKGSGGHNFAAPKFFAAAEVDPADAATVANGTVELAKAGSNSVRLVPAPGTYKVKCTHFMHSAFGMKGVINVN